MNKKTWNKHNQTIFNIVNLGLLELKRNKHLSNNDYNSIMDYIHEDMEYDN